MTSSWRWAGMQRADKKGTLKKQREGVLCLIAKKPSWP